MPSLELDFFYGLLGAILFRIRNDQTDYQNWIFGFVIGLFLSQVLFVYGSEIVGQIIWVISAIGLSVAYFLRFTEKVRRRMIDFLKLACIGLLIIYPITFYTIVPLPGEYWGILRSLTLPFVAVIYIYDRWVLKKESMKKEVRHYLGCTDPSNFSIVHFRAYSESRGGQTQRACGRVRQEGGGRKIQCGKNPNAIR